LVLRLKVKIKVKVKVKKSGFGGQRFSDFLTCGRGWTIR